MPDDGDFEVEHIIPLRRWPASMAGKPQVIVDVLRGYRASRELESR